MKIIIIGGKGLIASKIANNLQQLNHTVACISPKEFTDNLKNGYGDEIFKDSDIIIDVSNPVSYEEKTNADSFQKSILKLFTSDTNKDAKHYILLSIVGADRFPESKYMQAKMQQEHTIETSGIPYSILRSTQFFESAGDIIHASTQGEEVHVSPAAFQPIASEEVVDALVELVQKTPFNNTIELAGPVCMPMYEFVRYYLNEMEDSRHLVEDKDALYFETTLNDQSLVPAMDAVLGKIKYEDWFLAQLVEE